MPAAAVRATFEPVLGDGRARESAAESLELAPVECVHTQRTPFGCQELPRLPELLLHVTTTLLLPQRQNRAPQ